MKKIIYLVIVTAVVLALLSCVGLPLTVKDQSRKDAIEPVAWKEFDKSGQVKFLQVQDTALASEAGKGGTLDGSAGERLVEIKVVDPAIQESVVEWTLKNTGKSTIWVVAAGGSEADLPVGIAGEDSITLKTNLDEGRYTYIVVDNEEGGKVALDIKAKCGETSAKTARGKSMHVTWF